MFHIINMQSVQTYVCYSHQVHGEGTTIFLVTRTDALLTDMAIVRWMICLTLQPNTHCNGKSGYISNSVINYNNITVITNFPDHNQYQIQ